MSTLRWMMFAAIDRAAFVVPGVDALRRAHSSRSPISWIVRPLGRPTAPAAAAAQV